MQKITTQLHYAVKKVTIAAFFILLCAGASAQDRQSLISATFVNEPLSEVLKELESKSGYRFVFNYTEVDGYNITATITGVEIRNAMNTILSGLPFEYAVEGVRITVKKTGAAATAGNVVEQQVTGRVTDQDGKPLVGVNVILRSTNKGTITDANGVYSLTVPTNGTLIFSYIGHQTQTIGIGARVMINVQMAVESQQIQNIVVDGYRTISQERSGGAFTIIGEEELEKKPVSNISHALTGLIPGMATSRSTVEGQTRFLIRGQGTLGTSSNEVDNRLDRDPLIVVDGFPIQGFTNNSMGGDGIRNSNDPFSTINPNDVESVTVLKDAAATSIYGARAANGVIVITTKKGKSTEKLNINVSGFVSIKSKPDLDYAYYMANTEDTFWYMNHLQEYYPSWTSSWYNPYTYSSSYNGVYINDAAMLMMELGRGNITEAEFNSRKAAMIANDGKWKNDLNKLVYRNAVNQQYNVSVRGGSDKANYSFSAAYDKEDTYQRGNSNERIMLNSINSFKLASRLTFDLGVNASFSNQTNNSISLSQLQNMISPWTRLINDDGTYPHIAAPSTANGTANNTVYYPILQDRYADKLPTSWEYNPVQDRQYIDNTSDRFNARVIAGLNYNIIDGLNVKVDGQYERTQYDEHKLYKQDSYYVRNYNNLYSTMNTATGMYQTYMPTGGVFYDKGYKYEGYDLRAQADYNKSFGRHDLVVVAGTEVRSSTTENTPTTWRYGYNEFTNAVLASPDYVTSKANIFGANVRMPYTALGGLVTLEDRFFAVYANAAYTFDRKYTLNASFRTDASNFQSKLSRDKFSPFWSVAGVWVLSREKFLEDVPWLNYLKFRVSIGEAGFAAGKYNQSAVTTLGINSGSLIWTNNEPYNTISARGNANLTWEKSRDLDLGLEFRLWDNKLYGNFTYYNRYSYDVLSSASIPIITQGVTTATFNNAAVANNGVELSLGSRLKVAGDLQWHGQLNFSYNKNVVRRYNVINTSIRPTYYPGYAIGTIWAYKAVGYTDEGYVILRGKDGTDEIVKNRAATHLYDSVNGAMGEKVEDYNWTYALGNRTPSTNLGFTSTFTYKGLTFSFMITGKFDYYFSSGYSYSERQDAPSISKTLKKAIKLHNEGYADQPYSVRPLWNDANKDVFATGSTWMYMSNLANYTTNYFRKGDHIRLNEVYLGYELPGSWLGDRRFIRSVNIYAQARDLGLLWSANKELDPDYTLREIKPMATFTFGLKINF